jgi:hypothetical protein
MGRDRHRLRPALWGKDADASAWLPRVLFLFQRRQLGGNRACHVREGLLQFPTARKGKKALPLAPRNPAGSRVERPGKPQAGGRAALKEDQMVDESNLLSEFALKLGELVTEYEAKGLGLEHIRAALAMALDQEKADLS